MIFVRWPVFQREAGERPPSRIVFVAEAAAAADLTWDRIVRAPARRPALPTPAPQLVGALTPAEAPADLTWDRVVRAPAQRPSFTSRPRLGIVAALDAGAEFLPPSLLRSRLRQSAPFSWLTQAREVVPAALDAGAENLPPIVYRPAAQTPSHTPKAQTFFVTPEEAVVEFPTPPVLRPQHQTPAFQAKTQTVFAAVVEAVVDAPTPPVFQPRFQSPSFTPVARVVFVAPLEAPSLVRAVLQRPSFVGRPRLVLVPSEVVVEFPPPQTLRPRFQKLAFQARTQTVVPPFVEVAPSVYVPVAFGRPSPSAGIIVGSPNGGIGSGSPNGGIGAGTPSAAMFGTPSPTHGD